MEKWKSDPEDQRWLQLLSSPEKANFVLLGYPDDEGIALSRGRIGAALAPDKIREFLFKMTPRKNAQNILADLGNISLQGNLSERHDRASLKAEEIFCKKQTLITLGGGHDYGFADAQAFLNVCKNPKQTAWIINFDAHLDVRPALNGFSSGTPFRRILEQFSPSKDKFNFLEIGLQPQCNSPHYAKWAKDHGAKLFWKDDIPEGKLPDFLKRKISCKGKPPMWISLDIDCITSRSAPGCSQSWEWGFSALEIRNAIRFLQKKFDVRGLGIYEVSPPLDIADQTSKLAALLVEDFIWSAP